jgi:hypothetical protein
MAPYRTRSSRGSPCVSRTGSGYLCLPWLPGSAQARVEVPGLTLSLAAARLDLGCGSFLACVLAGCRGEAWLKKGLPSSK